MQLRELRRVLQQVVLAGLPAGATACFDDVVPGSECTEAVERTIHISQPADTALQFRIDSCKVDVDACDELCTLAMQRMNIGEQHSACKVEFRESIVSVDVRYTVYHDGANCPVEGRRPDGLAQLHELCASSAAGAWLAHAAWLEAASVHAFARLANELAQRGAPDELIIAALAAVVDEVRHTAVVARLAERYGAIPPPPEVAPPVERSLEAMAIENAVEGCVRETWGAVLALWQSQTALDPEVRAAFREIAEDELRHAALAWAIERWARPQLDAAARARVDAARDAAAAEILDARESQTLAVLGLPESSVLRDLASRTHGSLWQGGRSCHA